MTPFFLRDAAYPADAPAIAAVYSAADPSWPTTPELVLHEHENRDPQYFFTQILAEQAGRVVGVGSIGHDSFSHEDWRYWASVNVHPDARRQGIGAALYDELLRRVQERGARELRTMLGDGPQDAPGAAFLKARGFEPRWERYESSLHTRDVNLTAFGDLMAQVAGRTERPGPRTLAPRTGLVAVSGRADGHRSDQTLPGPVD